MKNSNEMNEIVIMEVANDYNSKYHCESKQVADLSRCRSPFPISTILGEGY